MIVTICVILVFISFISMGIKIENHFEYLKKLNPQKLSEYNSWVDLSKKTIWNNKLSEEWVIMQSPWFGGRNTLVESGDENLKNLAVKIIRQLIISYASFVLFIIIVTTTFITK